MKKEKAPLGLYIHIPFCRQKCAYCDFYSLPSREDKMDAYTDATDLHQILIVGSSALIPQGDAFDQTYVFLHQLLQSAFFALLYIFEKQKIPLNIRHDGPLMTVSFPIEP